MVGVVNLGSVNFAATFNTAGLDAGTEAMRKMQAQVDSLQAKLNSVKSSKAAGPDKGFIDSTKTLLRSLAAQSTLTLGPLSGVAARIQALNVLMTASGVAGGIAVGALAGVSVGLFGVATAAIKAAINLQKAQLALEAVTGSAVEAGVQLNFVRQVSDQAGINFNIAARSWGRFEAAAKAAGLSLETTKKSFLETSLAAGKLSLGADDTAGVFRALEQILSKGTVQSEELRGQLADRFPAAFAIAAKAIGKTTIELNAMLKKGQVISSDFVPKFTEAMAKFYNIDISKPIDSLQASLNKAGNATTFFFVEVDKAFQISAAFKKVVDGVTVALNSMAQNLDKVKAIMGGVVGAFGGFIAASVAVRIIAGVIATATTATITFAGVLAGARTAVLALNAALLATPLGWVGLILRLAGAIAGYVVGVKLAEKVTRDLNRSMIDTKGIDEFIKAQLTLRTATDEATRAMIDQQKVATEIARRDFEDAKKAVDKIKAAATPAGAAKTAQISLMPMAALGMESMPLAQQAGQVANATVNTKALTEANRNLTEADIKLNQEIARTNMLQRILSTAIAPAAASSLSTVADSAKQARDKLASLLDTIKDNALEVQKYKTQWAALQAGIDPNDPKFLGIEALQKARDALSRVEPGQLPRVAKALSDLGYNGKTAEEAMTKLFLAMAEGKNKVDATTRALQEQADAAKDAFDVYSQAMRSKAEVEGRLAALQESGTAGAQMYDRTKAVQDQVRAYETLLRKQQLSNPSLSEAGISKMVSDYQALLTSTDELGLAYDKQTESIQNAESAMISWAETSLNAISDVIFEGKSLSSTFGSIIKSLEKMAVQILILEPLKNMFTNWVRGTDNLGQPNSSGGGMAAFLTNLGLKFMGFANGGLPPVGQPSIVGEHGPELFIPTHAGKIVSNSRMGGVGGGATMVDARTYIDARGASADAIAGLKQEIAARDARIRTELPWLVDTRVRDSRMRGRA